jgi:hypothetical protein
MVAAEAEVEAPPTSSIPAIAIEAIGQNRRRRRNSGILTSTLRRNNRAPRPNYNTRSLSGKQGNFRGTLTIGSSGKVIAADIRGWAH